MEKTSVKIMQCVLADSGQMNIECIGVGVGVFLHNRVKKMAAGLHVLVPRSTSPDPPNPVKFANLAVPHALSLLQEKGVSAPLSVAIAGGASMEGAFSGTSMGPKVVEAVKEALSEANLSVTMDETGGSKIRSMSLDIETGKIDII